jgi:beta-glucanase (GH16 family)
MPDRVVWYFDGKVMNEYYDKANIPHRPMCLNVNYAIDGYYRQGDSKWTGPGEMVIDYIKVYQSKKITRQ